jgi:AcrR family transcriptional regulator
MAPRRARTADQVAERLDAIVAAATGVFAEVGYRRTQMSDIARAAGISSGSLYNYVQSKEALFALVLERALDKDAPSPIDLPVPARSLTGTTTWLRQRLDFREFPLLRSGSTDIEGVIGEIYDVLASVADAVDVIEASARDVPELGSVLNATRTELLRRLGNVLDAAAAAGVVQGMVDTGTTARLVLEAVNWFARRRVHGSAVPPYREDVARETVIRVLSRGLLNENRSAARSKEER